MGKKEFFQAWKDGLEDPRTDLGSRSTLAEINSAYSTKKLEQENLAGHYDKTVCNEEYLAHISPPGASGGK